MIDVIDVIDLIDVIDVIDLTPPSIVIDIQVRHPRPRLAIQRCILSSRILPSHVFFCSGGVDKSVLHGTNVHA